MDHPAILELATAAVLALVLGTGGCGSPSSDGRVDGDRRVDPSTNPETTTATDTASAADALDAEEVAHLEAAGERFASEAAGIDFPPVMAAVHGLEGRYDPSCPALETMDLGDGWFQEDCVTGDGTWFWGSYILVTAGWLAFVQDQIGTAILDEWGPVVEPGWTPPPTTPAPRMAWHMGFLDVEGHQDRIAMTGEYRDVFTDWDGVTVELIHLPGEVVDDRPTQAETWIGRGIVPNLTRAILRGTSGGRVHLYHGALSRLPTRFDTVWATDLSMGNAAAGDPCEAEPEGLLSIRTPEGQWYDLAFDGDVGGECDGCARVSRGGVAVGAACPDLGALLGPER